MHSIRPILLFLLATLTMLSCKRKNDGTYWDTELLMPLANGEISMGSIINDSLLQYDPDGAVRLVYQNDLYKLNLAEEGLKVPDTTVTIFVKLDSLAIDNRQSIISITLGQIAKAENTGIGDAIIAANGSFLIIPPITNISATSQPIDGTDLFQSAVIKSGFLDLEITNEFPIDITDLEFQLRNQSNGSVILHDNYDTIKKQQSVIRTYPLDGKTVDGNMLADIISMNSPGSKGKLVKIDTTDAIILKATVRDLQLVSAEAIFPSQDLINSQTDVVYDFGGAQLTDMLVRTGELYIKAYNTIEDTLKLQFALPGAVSPSGQPVLVNAAVPPAIGNQKTTIDQVYDLSGYNISLRGKSGNRVNAFYQVFIARIDSTGKQIYISTEDSVEVEYGLRNIVPEYAAGYLGHYNYSTGLQSLAFKFFSKVHSGTLDLDKLDMALSITNQIGASGTINFNTIQAIKSSTGQSVGLNASIIGSNIEIPRAIKNPFTEGYKRIELNEQNSNVLDLIELLPDRISYQMDAEVNPNGNEFNFQDFIFYERGLRVSLDVEMPITFQAKMLELRDTAEIDIDPSTLHVKSGELRLTVTNGFPFDATIQVLFLNDDDAVLDSLFVKPNTILAGTLDPANCRVAGPVETILKGMADEAQMERIKGASRIVFKAKVNTSQLPSCMGPLKIYSDYIMSFKLGAKFIYNPKVEL